MALTAIEKSCQLKTAGDSLFIQAKTLFQLDRKAQATEVMLACVKHNDCGIDMALALATFAAEFSVEASERGYHYIANKFPGQETQVKIKCNRLNRFLKQLQIRDALPVFDSLLVHRLPSVLVDQLMHDLWTAIIQSHKATQYKVRVSIYLHTRA